MRLAVVANSHVWPTVCSTVRRGRTGGDGYVRRARAG
jgi:hypothetical protein